MNFKKCFRDRFLSARNIAKMAKKYRPDVIEKWKKERKILSFLQNEGLELYGSFTFSFNHKEGTIEANFRTSNSRTGTLIFNKEGEFDISLNKRGYDNMFVSWTKSLYTLKKAEGQIFKDNQSFSAYIDEITGGEEVRCLFPDGETVIDFHCDKYLVTTKNLFGSLYVENIQRMIRIS
jgi:hypothetical protein